jgi:hypothetical protein
MAPEHPPSPPAWQNPAPHLNDDYPTAPALAAPGLGDAEPPFSPPPVQSLPPLPTRPSEDK